MICNALQKQQNSLIAGLRATNEALLKQETAIIGVGSNLQAEVTSGGTSNGSVEKKDASPDSQDALQTDHAKETTPSTSMCSFSFSFEKWNRIFKKIKYFHYL